MIFSQNIKENPYIKLGNPPPWQKQYVILLELCVIFSRKYQEFKISRHMLHKSSGRGYKVGICRQGIHIFLYE